MPIRCDVLSPVMKRLSVGRTTGERNSPFIRYGGVCCSRRFDGAGAGRYRPLRVRHGIPRGLHCPAPWHVERFAKPRLIGLIVAAATFLLVPGAWFVLAGTVAGIA